MDPGGHAWEGWWLDETGGWHEPEQMTPEEYGLDSQGLEGMKCHVCGANPKGGGKGGEAVGKGGGYREDQMGAPKGGCNGDKNSHLYCTTCGKTGHLPDRCWKTYPDLQRKKKVQGVKGKGENKTWV